MTELLDSIRGALVGLKMPRAMEALDHTVQRLERGEITAIEAIDALSGEEYVTRESRGIDVALRTAKLLPVKTLRCFDFSFQPSLDRERISASPSSTSSGVPRSCTSSDHPAPARAISPPPSALPRSGPVPTSTARRWPN